MRLTVTNWERWQSYRADRGQPPWIKLHRTVMRNPEWLALTDEQRGHLVQIWLIAADKHGVIIAPDVAQFVQKACGCANPPDLKSLETLRFISVDANVTPELRQPDANLTPTRRQLDAPEESREEETRVEESRGEENRGEEPHQNSAPPAALDFTVKGGRQWVLTNEQVNEWELLYPGLDVMEECRKAFAWIRADDKRQKTEGGMKRFLVGWLNRCQPTEPPRPPGPTVGSEFSWTEADQAAYDAEKAKERLTLAAISRTNLL